MGASLGCRSGAGPQHSLTCALAVCEHIAWLTGERLVAPEGARRVHTVLVPGARVQVRHALVDVCVEIKAAVKAWGWGVGLQGHGPSTTRHQEAENTRL